MAIMIKSTPPWVWFLLAFLVYRGIKALAPRKMTPQRMLLLPIVFLVWALVGIFFELRNLSIALPVFVATLALGGALGWQLALRQPRASLERESGLVQRPGSAMPLVLICIGFSLKYAISVFLARHAGLGETPIICALYGAVSGIVDGTFWGITAAQFSHALRSADVKPSPVKLLGMVFSGGGTITETPSGPNTNP
jgi:hypothetical protein